MLILQLLDKCCATIARAVLLCALLWLSPFANGQNPETTGKAERVVAVSSLVLKPTSSFEVKRQFSGQIEARRRSHLGFDRIGQISQIFVDRGDEVVAGQLIASLDVDALRAQRHKLEADLRSAEALLREAQAGPRRETIAAARANLQEQQTQWDLAKETLERRENLFKKKFIAREELDQALAASARWSAIVDGATSQLNELLEGTRQERIDSQAAQVQSIEAAIAQVNVELQKSQIFAPYDGKVLVREVDEGSVVSPGQSVVSIVEYRKLEAKIGVSPVFAKKIAKGQALEVECNAIKLAGTVQAVVSEVDMTTRTQAVIVSLEENAWEQVTAGDTVRVSFAQKEKSSGFWVPTESLVAGPRGLWNCFVIENVKDGVGTTAVRTVELIHSEGDRSMISGPLQAGDVIIAAAPHRIIAGQAVRPIPAAESP
ncbi:MAG: efflux RND transporter periplasmic adaptor subunit [Pirellulaceae bacterium]|nr:efflux RND transporter periplasmic adaptor subunit [Pirellulaceae bacterium]